MRAFNCERIPIKGDIPCIYSHSDRCATYPSIKDPFLGFPLVILLPIRLIVRVKVFNVLELRFFIVSHNPANHGQIERGDVF